MEEKDHDSTVITLVRDKWVRKIVEAVIFSIVAIAIQAANAQDFSGDDWLRGGETILGYLALRFGFNRDK